MPKISTRVTFDKKAAAARMRAVANDALTVMGNEALKDVTQYVPLDQGTLQSSGLSSSDRAAHDMKFDLRWSTPYASIFGMVMSCMEILQAGHMVRRN